MLSVQEKLVIADCIVGFSVRLILAGSDERKIRAELDDFYEFVCGALTCAKRDGKREALTTTN